MLDTAGDFVTAVFLETRAEIAVPESLWNEGPRALQEAPSVERAARHSIDGRDLSSVRRSGSSTSLRELLAHLVVRRRIAAAILGSMLLTCFFYCLIAPREYEARARIALRVVTATSLSMEAPPAVSNSALSAPVQLETVAGILRSDRLAWKVIRDQKLYAAPAFQGRFAARYPGFRPDSPDINAQTWLLERFQDRLHVGTLPRTLLVEIRFRSRDPRLSAAVVNALIDAYGQQQKEMRQQATDDATTKLRTQLAALRARAEQDDQRLFAYQRKHGILMSPETLTDGKSGAEHLPALVEVDELGQALAAANSERILREAEYRAATQGDPEVVLAFDPRVQSDGSNLAGVFRSIRARQSDLEQELAQLSIERGPNFPRVLEIRQQLKDLDRQLEAENAKLRERFRSAWAAAKDHQRLVQKNLEERTREGMSIDEAVTAYEGMRREANATRDLYLQMQGKVEEAGLAVGVHDADIWVVDEARPPAKPVAPDLPLYLAITLFLGLWIAAGTALLLESLWPTVSRVSSVSRVIVGLLAFSATSAVVYAQAPTPSTQGIPTGVAKIPVTTDNKATPNPKEAPEVWNGAGANGAGLPAGAANLSSAPMPAPISPGDLLDITEYHTPEFHSTVRVTTAGTVKLPLVDEVAVEGMDEVGASRAIAAALVERGILNHPQVAVLITAYVGLDVSVLGEVTRPGVYPYTAHHRLLDMISAASGLSPAAGAVVNIYHRSDPATPHPIALDRNGTEGGPDRNPELSPGDMVEVSRAGLVYVVGDVIRPGGFTVDPTQELTVLKALSLAWGPSQNAALGKALLIREQKSGRMVTSLDLKRMLHGQDPDQPIGDRDILFVPNSAVKNLYNRTIEAAVQSAVGVSIYAGLVYSDRF